MINIQKITIEGYKGIDYFEYTPNKINIFVGRNNTGKSSILEATALVATATTGFYDKLGNNILEGIIKRKGWKSLRYLIKLGQEQFKISAITIGQEISLEAHYLQEGRKILNEKIITLLQGYVRDYLGAVFPVENRKSLMRYREFFDEIVLSPMVVLTVLPIEKIAVIPEKEETVLISDTKSPADVLFYGYGMSELLDLGRLHDRLLPTAIFHRVIEYVRERLPYLKDIRSRGEELWVYLFDLDEPLPISMIGDGTRETIRLAFISGVVRGGLIFLEEPENHLHPGLYSVVAEGLVESVKRDGTQIFLSTHNEEFARSLIELGSDLVNVVRLYRDAGNISYEILSSEEALEEMEKLQMDLRGP